MPDLPGRLNRGLINFVRMVPKNSKRPKSRTRGRKSPANVKTAKSVGMSSKNTRAPVFLEMIARGPSFVNVRSANKAPSILRTTQIHDGVRSKL
mgnify:CR=1 FL=1